MEEIKEETYIPAEKSDHPIRRRVFLGMLACLAVIILGVVWFVADTLADAPPLDADDIAPTATVPQYWTGMGRKW